MRQMQALIAPTLEPTPSPTETASNYWVGLERPSSLTEFTHDDPRRLWIGEGSIRPASSWDDWAQHLCTNDPRANQATVSIDANVAGDHWRTPLS